MGVDDRAVAIPFEVGDAGIFRHQTVHDAEDEVLHFGVGEVQHQLVPEVGFVAVGITQYPVAVLFIQLAAGIDHFGFDPETEADALALGSFDQSGDAAGQFAAGFVPISESLRVVVPRMLVAEPSVVEQEHVHAEFRRVVHERREFFFVEVEIGCLPVVEQRHAVLAAVFELVAARPVVQAAACASGSPGAEGEDEFRRAEDFMGTQGVFRREGVDAGEDAQAVVLVHFEGEPEIARPCQRAQKHLPFGFGHRAVEGYGEQRRAEHVGPRAERRIEYLLAEVEPALALVDLVRPVSGKFGQVVAPGSEAKHRRCVFVQGDGFALVVYDLGPALDDVLAFEGG